MDDLEHVDPKTLVGWARNPRVNEPAVPAVARSIERFGFGAPVVARPSDRRVLAGHTRLKAAAQLGLATVPVRWLELAGAEADAFALADNRLGELAEWDDAGLAAVLRDLRVEEVDLAGLGWNGADMDGLFREPGSCSEDAVRPSFVEQFGAPPFSVFDARQGYWQDRKRAWLALGIRSELGRPGAGTPINIANWAFENGKSGVPIPLKHGRMCTGKNSAMNRMSGRLARDIDDSTDVVSIFDPVLAEIAVRWFSPSGGRVLDPFAGGSVRGIVASVLGRRYVGIDLREEQVAENWAQLVEIEQRISLVPRPEWIVGDARAMAKHTAGSFDLLFSCPPYADLERYSDDPRDLSTMDYGMFLEAYREIAVAGVAALAPDRFAVFVVGEVRDDSGRYRGFVPETIRAFEDAGANYYGEAILVTAIGTLPMRTRIAFEVSRKLGKAHQNVLVFIKGDPEKAAEAVGRVDFRDADILDVSGT